MHHSIFNSCPKFLRIHPVGHLAKTKILFNHYNFHYPQLLASVYISSQK